MGWLTALLGLADPITKITQAIANAKVEAAKVQTDQERIHAEERVKALEARRDVLIEQSRVKATQSSLPAIIAGIISLGPIGYYLKIFLWDKVIGSFVLGLNPASVLARTFETDPLNTDQIAVCSAVLAFYFLYAAVKR